MLLSDAVSQKKGVYVCFRLLHHLHYSEQERDLPFAGNTHVKETQKETNADS